MLISQMISKIYDRNRLSQPPPKSKGIELHNKLSSGAGDGIMSTITTGHGDATARYSQQLNQVKSPEPIFKDNFGKNNKDSFSNFTTSTITGQQQSQASSVIKTRGSNEQTSKDPNVATIYTLKKEIQNYQSSSKVQNVQFTVTSITKNREDSNNTSLQQQFQSEKTNPNVTLSSSNNHTTINDQNLTAKKQSSTKPINQKISKKDKSTKISTGGEKSLNQPVIIHSTSSPRINTQQYQNNSLGNSVGISSTFLSGTESVVSNYHNQHPNSKESKITLSEKIAPKGKKKRPNAQKQPKQISITKEQINLQTQNIAQTQEAQDPNINSVKIDQSYVNQSKTSKDNITQNNEEIPFEIVQNNTSKIPIVVFNDLDKIYNNQKVTQNAQGIKSDSNNPQPETTNEHCESSSTPTKKDKSTVSHLFSFHNYNQNFRQHQQTTESNQINPCKTSVMEESKECTGFFGGLFKDDSEFKRSFGGTAEEKPVQVEIPTPAFQNTSHGCSRLSFRPSETNLTPERLRLTTEESNGDGNATTSYRNAKDKNDSNFKTTLNDIQQNVSSKITNQPRENKKIQEFTIDLSEKEMHNEKGSSHIIFQEISGEKNQDDILGEQKTHKKVRSSIEQMSLHQNEKIQTLEQMKDQQQNTPRSGSLFSKLKNYFYRNEAKPEPVPKKPDKQYRCDCEQNDEPYACAMALKWITFSNNEFEYEKNKSLYEDLIKLTAPSGSETQIERDISRTFPNKDPYMSQQEGQQRLQRVLTAFSKYDSSIGYVQGMNFIVGALLVHCSEEIAFWLFVSLIEDYEMRDIYQPKLPGLYKHSQVIQLLEMEYLGSLHDHFCTHHIQVEMYASDWIFALFSNIIPITKYHLFLDQFFKGGWPFFYKFFLSFLKSLSVDLIQCDDISEILTIIKLKHVKNEAGVRYSSGGGGGGYSPFRTSNVSRFKSYDSNQYASYQDNSSQRDQSSTSPIPREKTFQTKMLSFIDKLVTSREMKIDSESYKDERVWDKLVEISLKEWEQDFNESYIMGLLSNFDQENLVFKNSFFANTPKDQSPPSSKRKHDDIFLISEKQSHIFTSQDSNNSYSNREITMTKYELMQGDAKSNKASGPDNPSQKSSNKIKSFTKQHHQPKTVSIYLLDDQFGSIQPHQFQQNRYQQQQKLQAFENLPINKSHSSRSNQPSLKTSSRKIGGATGAVSSANNNNNKIKRLGSNASAGARSIRSGLHIQ